MSEEVNKAINYIQDSFKATITHKENFEIVLNYIDKLQKELDKKDKEIEELKKESVSKKQIRNVLRKVQDYNLNFKDLALFNIINSELLGDNLWKDRIEEE